MKKRQVESAKMAAHQNGTRRSPAVQGILKAAKKDGPLSKVGVLGRLGDLATIPPEYDVAISTACGLLDHIVVQTTAGAQRCLEFLRQHDLGRANFIPLDKMKKGAHDQVVETPENAPRLFELITPSDFQITPALFLAVGNTLVAPDLDTATRWAYEFGRRWRVVTVDGQLLDAAGTMSGGGKSVRRGGMKLSSGVSMDVDSNDDIASVSQKEQELTQANELLHECKRVRKELLEEIQAKKQRVKKLKVLIPKLEIQIGSFDSTRTELTASIPELRAQCEMTPKEAEQLKAYQKEVKEIEKEMGPSTKLFEAAEAKVAKLQKEIMEANSTTEVKKQEKICEKLSKEMNETDKQLQTARLTVKTSEKAACKALAAKEAAEREAEELELAYKAKKEEKKTMEVDALEVMTAYNAVVEEEEKKRLEQEDVEKKVSDLKKELVQSKSVEVDIKAKLENVDISQKNCIAALAQCEKALQRLRAEAEEDDSDDDEDEEEGNEGLVDEDTRKKRTLPVLTPEELGDYSKGQLKDTIAKLQAEQEELAKNANMGAIAEYRKKENDYLSRVTELDTVTEQCNAARQQHEDLRRQRLDMFMDGFSKITLKLKEMYQMITLGGDAELELVDSLDPFSEGIVFSVRPPKKSWKNISNLSGGEKTLSSLALVFALHHFKPTPLYVMDEIDAALDFKNVSIVANYIKDRTKNAQFIIISLRNNMFELADRLVGIYKTNNCTKSVTINPTVFGVKGQQNGVVPTTPAGALTDRSNRNSGTSSMGVPLPASPTPSPMRS